MPASNRVILPLPFPTKGLNEVLDYDNFPPNCAIDVLNVRAFEPRTGRQRGGQRTGLGKWAGAAVGTQPIRGILQTSIDSVGGSPIYTNTFTHADGVVNVTQTATVWGEKYKVSSNRALFDWSSPSSDSTLIVSPSTIFYTTDNVMFTFNAYDVVYDGGNPTTVRIACQVSYTSNSWYTRVSLQGTGAYINIFGSTDTVNYAGGVHFTGDEAVSIQVTKTNVRIVFNGVVVVDHSIVAKLASQGVTPTPTCGVRVDCSSGNFSDATTMDNLVIRASSSILYAPRIVIIEGGNISRWTAAGYATPTNGTGAVSPIGEVSLDQAYAKVYFADGNGKPKVYDPGTDAVTTLVESAGTAPSDARLTALYHGRLVLTRVPTDPRNWFMSKATDPTNWDYSDLTVTGACSGNDGLQAGLLGDIITAFIPFGDTYALIGQPNETYVMRGDPKAGGNIELISAQIGIVGPKAWCQGPDGTIFFLSQNGLYELTRNGSSPKPISRNRLQKTFDAIDFSINDVEMAWNLGDESVYICIRPVDQSAVTMIVWDARVDAFWKDTYPATMGPSAMGAVYFGTAANRILLMGGWDSYLRSFNPDSLTDDGTAITSRVRYAPKIIPGFMMRNISHPMRDHFGKIIQGRFNWAKGDLLHDTNFNAVYKYFVGSHPQDAALSTTAAHTQRVYQGGYQSLDRQGARGGAVCLEISNDVSGKTWAIESAMLETQQSGGMRP